MKGEDKLCEYRGQQKPINGFEIIWSIKKSINSVKSLEQRYFVMLRSTAIWKKIIQKAILATRKRGRPAIMDEIHLERLL